MPLQNRVTPTGDIVADDSRGLMMGNRGCLHDRAAVSGLVGQRSNLIQGGLNSGWRCPCRRKRLALGLCCRSWCRLHGQTRPAYVSRNPA